METNYSSRSLVELKELAKSRGLKNISALRKQEVIDLLCSVDKKRDELKKGKEDIEKKEKVETKAKTEKKVSVAKATKNEDVKKVAKSDDKELKSEDTNKDTRTSTNKETKDTRTTVTHNTQNIGANTSSHGAASSTKERENSTRGHNHNNGLHNSGSYSNNYNNNRSNNNYSKSENGYQKNENGFNKGEYNSNYKDRSIHKNNNSDRENVVSKGLSTHRDQLVDQLDSGETKDGILEVLPDGYGFIRCDNYLPGENDVYVSPAQIRKFNLKTGDIVVGNTRIKNQNEKFSALLYVKTINGFAPVDAQKRKKFEDLTPIFPNERIRLETPGAGIAMRMVDLVSPIGKGQRGMIVSQPKAGKTTLLKQIAKSITKNYPDMKLIILLIDERPEEVTDIKESIEGKNVEVIYSTFDELPENHKRVSEMVIERAKRLVEHRKDVVVLLDSITRLARAYNLTVQPSGRTLSGGLDPAALHMPKRFFGAARNMREGGSLTILSTALVDTGSRMDDVVFEEFKGTGNMELVLDRKLSEKRIFPAIDLARSSTRRDDLLLTQSESEATFLMHRALNSMKSEEALERIIDMFIRTKTNNEFIEIIKKTKIV